MKKIQFVSLTLFLCLSFSIQAQTGLVDEERLMLAEQKILRSEEALLINADNIIKTDPTVLESLIVDQDDDGMDDDWETSNELDPSDPTDAWSDADGDNIINLYEYQLETDPNSQVSPVVLELTPLDGADLLTDAVKSAEGNMTVIRLSQGQYNAEVLAVFNMEYKLMIQGGWNDNFTNYNPEFFPTYWTGSGDEAINILHLEGGLSSKSVAIMDGINFSASDHFTLGGALNINSQVASSVVCISNCSFTSCTYYGLGIYHRGNLESGQVFINKCVIGNNTKGGMYTQVVNNAKVRWRLFNCTINNPNSPEGGIDGLTADEGSLRAELTNCINYGNTEAAFNFFSFNDFEANLLNSNVDESSNDVVVNDLGNNINEDPQFQDAVNSDWSLLIGSPCINTGVDVGLSYNDGAPDMGAIESGVSSVPQFNEPIPFTIFPNPFTDYIGVDLEEIKGQKVDIRIYSLAGNMISDQEQIVNGKLSIDASSLNCGAYLLEINTDKKRYHARVLKF